jgi:pilus assembly protein CpaF
MMGGCRKVIRVSEITGMEGDVISMHDIFEFRKTGLDENRAVVGYFQATGIRPNCLQRFSDSGISLPVDLFERRQLETSRSFSK